MPTHERQSPTESLSSVDLLRHGAIEVVGRLPWSSNGTFLVELTHEGQSGRAVYKPEEGEQDLWDFPRGIYKREVAAYVLSNTLGWPTIPLTIEREDAPMGIGSLQEFVLADFEQHYFTIFEDGRHNDELMKIATFDLVTNNTDRKSGHCLLGEDDHIYAIDNGLCFHEEPKLRTVIWDFQTTAIPEPLLNDLNAKASELSEAVAQYLGSDELAAMNLRIDEILNNPVFPAITSQRQLPWPIV